VYKHPSKSKKKTLRGETRFYPPFSSQEKIAVFEYSVLSIVLPSTEMGTRTR